MRNYLFAILVALLPITASADAYIPAGSASSPVQCVDIVFRDTSVSSSWTGKTALLYNTPNLKCYWTRNTDTGTTQLTLASNTLGSWVSGGWNQVDPTNMKGQYRICLSNAAVALGADSVTLTCSGATDMEQQSLRVSLISPNTYGFDGKLAAKSGTSLTLASGAIDVDNQFAYRSEVVFFDVNGLQEESSCITASVASTEVVTTSEDISAALTVNDNYVIRPNGACRALRATVAGRPLDVTTTGEAGLDFSNIAGTLDAAEIGTDAITAAKIAADAIGASEIAADAIGSSEIATDAIGASEIATDAIGAAEIAASAIGTSEFAAEADINAEVVDALATDTYGELSSCPTATASLTTMMRYLFALAKGKLEQNSSGMKVYKDDGSTVLCTSSTTNSSGLFTRGKLN